MCVCARRVFVSLKRSLCVLSAGAFILMKGQSGACRGLIWLRARWGASVLTQSSGKGMLKAERDGEETVYETE